LFPNKARFELFITQEAVELVMTKMLVVVGKVSQRIIDLTTEQILTVIKASDSLFIGNEHSQRLSDFLCLRKS